MNKVKLIQIEKTFYHSFSNKLINTDIFAIQFLVHFVSRLHHAPVVLNLFWLAAHFSSEIFLQK